jgi:hypothetical protein
LALFPKPSFAKAKILVLVFTILPFIAIWPIRQRLCGSFDPVKSGTGFIDQWSVVIPRPSTNVARNAPTLLSSDNAEKQAE